LRQLLVIFGFIALFAGIPANAEIVSTEEASQEMVLGKADAPVTVIEFSSMTCPHCAAFHNQTLPTIKKEYIDTGKVRLVSRDFPLDGLALAASMVARCAGPSRYFGLIQVMFRTQERWAQSSNPRGDLVSMARFAGMSEKDVDACLNNEALLKSIQAGARQGREEFEVESTPTFFVDGEKVSGAMPIEDFRKVLDAAVAKKQ
jgi:protein-disulfide isomerase